MKLGLLLPTNIYFCPYVKIYTDVLDKNNIQMIITTTLKIQISIIIIINKIILRTSVILNKVIHKITTIKTINKILLIILNKILMRKLTMSKIIK